MSSTAKEKGSKRARTVASEGNGTGATLLDHRRAERFITDRYGKMLTNWPVAGGVEDGICEGIMDYGSNESVHKHLIPRYAQLAAKLDANAIDTPLLRAMKSFEDEVKALNSQAEKVNEALMVMHGEVEKEVEEGEGDDYADRGETDDD